MLCMRAFHDLATRKGPALFTGTGASFLSSTGGVVFFRSHGRPSFSVDAGECLYYSSPAWDEMALSVSLTFIRRERRVSRTL
jgi:hypothetical protein